MNREEDIKERSDQESTLQYAYMEQAKEMIKQQVASLGRDLTFCVVTFGCQMNARDSEKLTGILEQIGYRKTDQEDADLVIYNTCTVRDNANTRVYGRLGKLKNYKQKNPHMLIALCGCMMQEPSAVERIKEKYRFVDMIFGTHNIFKFAELLVTKLQTEQNNGSDAHSMVIDIWKDTDLIVEDLPIERKYPFKSGVNIMFGCNNFCSYCIVPYVRGRERSRKPEDILAEIRRLADDGVKEIMLLGQNVNSYGKNLESPVTFAKLLQMIEEIEGIKRIRFMTSHPKDLSDELIEAMASSGKICHHLHLPLQSGSTDILSKMNRRYTKEQFIDLAARVRKAIPDIAITTDIIIGFPGETDQDVDDTIDVIQKVRFDGAFTFIYSKRTGTPAAAMEDQVPEDVVKRNFDRVLNVVQDVSREMAERFEGMTDTVLVEGINEQDQTLLTGRLGNNLLVHFPGDAKLIGQIVRVRLTECKGFYYLGTRCDS
ncbi:MAG: tRNA (N6-isopentenyl adenosine(37)-C2)-methylthiotransferase MiaB [bacterium]|nr:tRNA (N6-isopentenyl adenosine(37)-C2)-methylthiotransferase MiaB [bacterium]